MSRSRAHQALLLGADSWRLFRRMGVSGLRSRLLHVANYRWGQEQTTFSLMPGDIVSSTEVVLSTDIPPPPADRALTVGWVCVPPGPGSGGHTTMFRMIEALESAGHTCVLYLYDRFEGDIRRRQDVIRTHWPQIRAEVRDVHDGVRGVDALVATSWGTAHVVARHSTDVRRCFYFVQDFEPYFYPRGSEYVLAEDTFRFGFHGLTAGWWLAQILTERYGMRCDHFDFGADATVYSNAGGQRDGVVFYAKPFVARRGYDIGIAALQRFSTRRPGVPIHLFGEPTGPLPFDARSHGRLSPPQLNGLYNTCRTGLSLSFSNVSLIPWELLRCGVVPVVNDADHNHVVLDNSQVRWAPPTVRGLADALVDAYDSYSSRVGAQCAASVVNASWDDAGRAVVDAITHHTYL